MTWFEEETKTPVVEEVVEISPLKKTRKRKPKLVTEYVAVRGITYERVTPKVRVEPGQDVPAVILEDASVFNHYVRNGVIKKR